MVLAAVGGETALAFIELGAVALGMAVLARLASRWGITAIPFYLIAGLAVGEGGVAPLDVSEDFISLAAEIGVLLLLLTLGLEYTPQELRSGLRAGIVPGLIDAALNFTPGFIAGLALGWDVEAAVLLGGVCWVSSSGMVAKIVSDHGWLGNREAPTILNLLVIEDLAMAVYLPVAATLVTGAEPTDAALTISVAVVVVVAVLMLAMRWGVVLSRLLRGATNESLLLAVFGLTLLVGGLAEQVEVSAAIGAFLVGLALSGAVQERAGTLIEPLRDLFAATFFLFFSFQIQPGTLPDAIPVAVALALVTGAGKLATGWLAAGRAGVGPTGRIRAGSALVARGEFSIVIASLGATLIDSEELRALAAAYVLLTAMAGPVLAKYADHLAPSPRV